MADTTNDAPGDEVSENAKDQARKAVVDMISKFLGEQLKTFIGRPANSQLLSESRQCILMVARRFLQDQYGDRVRLVDIKLTSDGDDLDVDIVLTNDNDAAEETVKT